MISKPQLSSVCENCELHLEVMDAASLLLTGASRFGSLDLDLARETYLQAWGAALYAGRLAIGASVVDVSRAARATPPRTNPARPIDLLRGLIALMDQATARV